MFPGKHASICIHAVRTGLLACHEGSVNTIARQPYISLRLGLTSNEVFTKKGNYERELKEELDQGKEGHESNNSSGSERERYVVVCLIEPIACQGVSTQSKNIICRDSLRFQHLIFTTIRYDDAIRSINGFSSFE